MASLPLVQALLDVACLNPSVHGWHHHALRMESVTLPLMKFAWNQCQLKSHLQSLPIQIRFYDDMESSHPLVDPYYLLPHLLVQSYAQAHQSQKRKSLHPLLCLF